MKPVTIPGMIRNEGSAPYLMHGDVVVTCWRPSWRELWRLISRRKLYLYMQLKQPGQRGADNIYLSTNYTIIKDSR